MTYQSKNKKTNKLYRRDEAAKKGSIKLNKETKEKDKQNNSSLQNAVQRFVLFLEDHDRHSKSSYSSLRRSDLQ